MQTIIESLNYVLTAPYFWESMSLLTASGIFIGSVVYNGDYERLKRGLITLLPLISFWLMATISRINSVEIANHYQAYAGTITILLVTIFYFIGMLMGVFITRHIHRKRDRLNALSSR